MSELLIFGGTSEGRRLAELCAERGIAVSVSVTTAYGAELLPKNKSINIMIGRLDRPQIERLIAGGRFDPIIDATHPYAALATENIRAACTATGRSLYRLVREEQPALAGKVVDRIDEAIDELNRSDKRVLSTLGSKELPLLKSVINYRSRVWVRALPAEGIAEYCASLGFDREKVILGKGPFSVGENIAHIRQSGVQILLTKESGEAGGYPQKVEAAKSAGIGLITLRRPRESGYTIGELEKIICQRSEYQT
ncbi:MAG: precorrin-6A reductase [Bacteroides sp.]|nr:precorrin-6A reductase [Eubacterium sp.]MCM1417861.1 precorrin-6A reductase [Roseburia sp.]MCM1461300.1 precorrin-6A reductase [Bacteroides sp.]